MHWKWQWITDFCGMDHEGSSGQRCMLPRIWTRMPSRPCPCCETSYLEYKFINLLNGHNRRTAAIATRKDLFLIYDAQGRRCAICRFRFTRHQFELDHKQPIYKGGTNHPRNIWFLCAKCHKRKTRKDMSGPRNVSQSPSIAPSMPASKPSLVEKTSALQLTFGSSFENFSLNPTLPLDNLISR